MSKFKRVLAFLGCALVLISTFVVSVSADVLTGQTSSEKERIEQASKELLLDSYNFPVGSASKSLVEVLLQNDLFTHSTAFFVGNDKGEDYNYVLGASRECKLSQKFLRGFTTGFRSNECLDTAVVMMHLYNPDNSVAASYGGKCVVYYDVNYNKYTYISFMLKDNPELRSIEIAYKPTTTYQTDEGNNVCGYIMDKVKVKQKDGAVVATYADGYKMDMAIAFYDEDNGRFYCPDYVTSTLLCGASPLYTGIYLDRWRFPLEEYQAIKNSYVKIWNDSHNVAFGEGYESGITDCEGTHEGMQQTARDEGYTDGYDIGYTGGYADGERDGLFVGQGQGYDSGYNDGYNEGFKLGDVNGFGRGQKDIKEAPETFRDFVVGVFEAPLTLIDGMLNFDIFGVNVAGLVKVLLTLSVTAAILFAVLKITRG